MARPTAVAAAAVVLASLVVAACGSPRSGPTYPPAGATPIAATTETAAARDAVVAAVAATGLVAAPNPQPYRPPEGPWLAGAPRTVVELDAPAAGPLAYVVLYGLGSEADARAAAADQAAYVARPTTQIYFPGGSRFVIRALGNAVIFMAWSGSDDPRVAAVAAALEQLGTAAEPG